MSSSSPQMEHSVAEPEDESTFLLIVRNLESAPLFGMYGCDQRGSRGTTDIKGSRVVLERWIIRAGYKELQPVGTLVVGSPNTL